MAAQGGLIIGGDCKPIEILPARITGFQLAFHRFDPGHRRGNLLVALAIKIRLAYARVERRLFRLEGFDFLRQRRQFTLLFVAELAWLFAALVVGRGRQRGDAIGALLNFTGSVGDLPLVARPVFVAAGVFGELAAAFEDQACW